MSLGVCAQTPSGVGYPLAECNGGTCPAYTAVKSHITSTFLDTLTEKFYVAGQFRTLGGQTRIGIGAMNAVNGNLLPFAPVVDTFGCIYAMSIKGDTLFVGGRFSSINGTPRTNFAAIRISTGQLLPSFNGGIGGAGDTVFAITVYNGRIYVGGKFTTVFATSRTNIARLNYDGTVNAWAPGGVGIVRKTMQWRNRLLTVARVGTMDERLLRIDTSIAPTVTSLMTTTNSSAGMEQTLQDFVTRNDSVYVVGSFYEVDGNYYDGFIACNVTTGVKRTWGITIPTFGIDPRNRVHIEYYRDSLYIGVVDAGTQTQTYHRIYVAHYRGATLRVLKTYNSNQTGLNGDFCEGLVVGNARLMEIERFAQHTSFPFGSMFCRIFSWCLKIPTLCGNWFPTPPISVCPNDTFWLSVQHQYYYSSYSWSTITPGLILVPNFNSCMVITPPGFSGGTVRVQGVTSCGLMNSGLRTTNFGALALPSVSAGPDDTLSCIITSLTLYGSCTPAPISWSWTGPNAFSNADSVMINTPGTYYLECVHPNGCRKRDSAFVFADTIPPTIVPFGSLPQITCAQQSVTLDASAVYPNDSLRWIIGASSFSNPATASAPGNVFLVITDRDNGCSSTDTLTVTQNMSAPPVTAVYSDTLLTCSRDSILLSGFSPNPDVIFTWMDADSTTFIDPMYADTSGFFEVTGTDTVNGCSSSDFVLINAWYTPPSIIVATDSFNINCSYDSVLLVGSSLTTSAIFTWTDSMSFTASNPALTGQQGWYYLVVTDSLNGCSAVDSAYVGYEPTLDVVGYADTIICPGSGAVLNVFPIGGTPAFTYSWNNSGGNTALITVYPADTLAYIVTVNDAAGCTGFDTIIVNVPDPILDSTLSFQPCDPLQPTGQIQIYPWGGVPPYQFSSDNGLTWQSSGVFGSLTYGTYQFIIRDTIGCTHTTSALIDTNSLSPAPEFLVSTSPELGDTIVIVDISNPRPDSVVWDFPAGTTIVDTSMFSPSIIPADTGAFYITMHAWYGSCEVVLTRLISIQPFDSLNAQPWAMNQIDSLILYPNPNNGVFTVHTELEGKQNFVILVSDEMGNEHARVQVSHADEWTGTMSVNNPVPGNYVLRVIAEYDSAALPFIIAQ